MVPYIGRLLNKHLCPPTYSHNLFARDSHVHAASRRHAGLPYLRIKSEPRSALLDAACLARIATHAGDR